MSESKLEKEFYEHVEAGRTLPKQAPDKMLIAYGYFKQATSGDNTTERPLSSQDIIETFKHDQWSRMQGLSKEQAMIKYVSYIKDMIAEADAKN